MDIELEKLKKLEHALCDAIDILRDWQVEEEISMTKEQIKQTAEKELVAYLKGCAFSLCPASQKYMAEHIEEILKASETTKELEKKNAELKEQNANLIAMLEAEREVRVNDDYLKGICERDAEIDELKEQLECAEHNCKVKQGFNDNQFKAIMDFKKQADVNV